MRLLLLVPLLALPGLAAQPGQVKRGDLEVRVKITGTVVADDVFRIKASIDGRVEKVLTSTNAWHRPGDVLAYLSNPELAAMLDAKGTQNVNILEDRWQRVYKPTQVRCAQDCFILKNFMKPKSWVKPQTVFFEAAGTLKLIARVRPEDAPWVRDGQEVSFWSAKNPKQRLRGRVARFVLDIQGEKVSPGGTFTLVLSPDRSIEPGVECEGEIIPMAKKDVLIVPTASLIRSGGSVYLPVRVSTGITTQELTQITSGIEEKRDILILDDSQMGAAARHAQQIDPEALDRRAREPRADDDARDRDSAPEIEPVTKPGKHSNVLDGTDYGEDPYAEPQ
ncbi:MAG: efflux RND transporter periplasmic adaptor subunit [Elusimicrobia bacterium]|nr:efflux RND transporter periplasmic adaptor subunit [Elusimicrobiota bacterium]